MALVNFSYGKRKMKAHLVQNELHGVLNVDDLLDKATKVYIHHLTKNIMYYDRIKYIDIIYRLIRDIIFQDIIISNKIVNTDNPIDILIKSINVNKYKHCLDLIVFSIR